MKRTGGLAGLFIIAIVSIAAAEEAPAPEPIPTACVGEQPIKGTTACLMPGTFAKKLCAASYPDMALTLFAKGTPWTRVWLAGDVEAWNASGGYTSRTQLAFDEEVIVLSRHSAPATGGMVVTDAMPSFDVLRWDGSCVSVLEGELTMKRPPAPKPAAKMPWNRLEDATKRALLAAPKVKTSRDAVDKACASSEKAPCERAEKELGVAIAEAVRNGTPLPTPSRRP